MKINTRNKVPRGDLSLTAFGLGCSQMGGLYRATSDDEVSGVFTAAWDAGVRYFDTAPFYGYTRSEHRLGIQLADRERDSFVLSTKVGRLLQPDASVAPGDDDWATPYPFRPHFDYSYGGIMRSFADSLQRLGQARIDILYIHDIGRATHGDAHLEHWQQLTTGGGFRALGELRANGVIKAVGLGVNEWEVIHDSLQEFDLDIAMLANRYTLLEQHSLTLLDECQECGTAIVSAGVFNSGVLVGKNKFDYAAVPPDVVARVKALQATCAEFSVALPAAAIQFPMAHPAVISCVVGTRNPAQFVQNQTWFEQAIPVELWLALRESGLIDAQAPLPTCETA